MTQSIRQFIGIGHTGKPVTLVARFETPAGEGYYMTLGELCDWIERQIAGGIYYQARDAMEVDRAGLLALIAAQRKVLSGKMAITAYAAVIAAEKPFNAMTMQLAAPQPEAAS